MGGSQKELHSVGTGVQSSMFEHTHRQLSQKNAVFLYRPLVIVLAFLASIDMKMKCQRG